MPSQTEDFPSLESAAAAELVLLLKFARLYGPRHARTSAQLNGCWQKLQTALTEAHEALTLTIGRSEVLVGGTSLDFGSAEQSFRQALAKAGVAGITFSPDLTLDSLRKFTRAYAEAAMRPELLRKRFGTLFGDEASGIRLQVRERAATERKSAPSEEAEPESSAQGVSQRILRLLSEAEKSARNPYEFGEEFLGRMHARDAKPLGALSEDEARKLVRALAQAGEAGNGEARVEQTWKEDFSKAPASVRSALRQIVSEIEYADLVPSAEIAMARVAKSAAIHYAVERFEAGGLKAAAVEETLSRLAHEVPTPAAAPGPHHRKNGTGNGFHPPENTTEIEQEFWSALPESSLHTVISSAESACVPAHLVRRHIASLFESGDECAAKKILSQYARSAAHRDARIREKAAAGLAELSEIYVHAEEINFVLHVLGAQMAVESEPELQKRLGAAFVRFSQAAAERRSFGAVNEALDRLAGIEREKPERAAKLRPCAGIVNRIPEFIEHGVKQPRVSEELAEALRKMPQASADYLASRLMRVASGTEREQIVRLAQALGNPGCEHLRQTFQSSALVSGSRALGLLTRLDAPFVERLLPEKMLPQDQAGHDAALHQISTAGAPERGRMLAGALGKFDSKIAPLALDEIGMSGDSSVAPELLQLAEGALLPDSSDFLRVKAIEALGRVRSADAVPRLLQIIETRRAMRWMYPQEMRITAAQALVKIQPEFRAILDSAGFDAHQMAIAPLDARPERDFIRYRRSTRIPIPEPIPAIIHAKRGKLHPTISVLSLDGGLLKGDLPLTAGTCAGLRISSGLRPIRMEVMVRFARGNQAGIEMTGMTLDDRARLRNLLVSMSNTVVQNILLPA